MPNGTRWRMGRPVFVFVFPFCPNSLGYMIYIYAIKISGWLMLFWKPTYWISARTRRFFHFHEALGAWRNALSRKPVYTPSFQAWSNSYFHGLLRSASPTLIPLYPRPLVPMQVPFCLAWVLPFLGETCFLHFCDDKCSVWVCFNLKVRYFQGAAEGYCVGTWAKGK